jgi:hypothetical protein
MTNTTLYLCPEGDRLFTEWHNLSTQSDHAEADNKATMTAQANAAWMTYHDHRAKCQECTKVMK